MTAGELSLNKDRIENWHANFYEVQKPLLKAASIPVVGVLPAAALVVVGLVQVVVAAIIWAVCNKECNNPAKHMFTLCCQTLVLACTLSIGTAIMQAAYMYGKENVDSPFWVWDHSEMHPYYKS